MGTIKDDEQDVLIRQNAEHIKKNEAAIQRQTECLEKIRDHYFPHRSVWKQTCGFFLKVVGAVTVYAGLMETADWYWNTRQSDSMAEQSAAVAKRLLQQENDAAGALRFLEKAVELDSGKVRYRIALAYVKGIAALVDLFDLERPFTDEERARVDACLAEAVFLQDVAPKESMPHVLSAQAYLLRNEPQAARKAVAKALEMAPGNLFARFNSCLLHYTAGEYAEACAEIAAAEAVGVKMPLIQFWKGRLAMAVEHDMAAARKQFAEMLEIAPRNAMAHAMIGMTYLQEKKPNLALARQEFAMALSSVPKMKIAMVMMADCFEREGNLVVARLWLDRALRLDAKCMKALVARARVCGKENAPEAAVADLTAAIELAPFRADLYLLRAEQCEKAGKKAQAEDDRRTAAALEKSAETVMARQSD